MTWLIERVRRFRCRCCQNIWMDQNCTVKCPKCGSCAVEEM